jgi:hypothetical protein
VKPRAGDSTLVTSYHPEEAIPIPTLAFPQNHNTAYAYLLLQLIPVPLIPFRSSHMPVACTWRSIDTSLGPLELRRRHLGSVPFSAEASILSRRVLRLWKGRVVADDIFLRFVVGERVCGG